VLRERLDDELIAFEHEDALADVTHLDSTIPDMLEALAVQDVTEPDGREAMLERQAESVIAQLRASVAEGGSDQRHVTGLAELVLA
jgi:hypothetical protein